VTVSAPTFSQIKAQVAAIRKSVPHKRTIGIRSSGRWTGERKKADGGESYLIEQCDSPLAMRIALREPIDEQMIKVLITDLDEKDLSEDILMRLAKRRLFPIDSWQIVKTLFQAKVIDPRVRKYHWIADELLEGSQTYPPAPGGFLDAETVWPILLERRIGLSGARPDLLALLKWSVDGTNVARFRNLSEQLRKAVIEWLSQSGGPTVEAILNCIVVNAEADQLPIGLAAGVVFSRQGSGALDKAIGRMEERYFGGKSPQKSMIERWAAAAAEVISLQLSDEKDAKARRDLLSRADQILSELGADSFAYVSRTSPIGFTQRLARFGEVLSKHRQNGSSKSMDELTQLKQAIRDHDQSKYERRRLDRIDMAVRLARWLMVNREPSNKEAPSIAVAASDYLREGAFVDWARLSLRPGDPVRLLSEAYSQLFDSVTVLREVQSRRFAELLRDWTQAGSTGKEVIPVEKILDEVIAPLAAQAPVLVVIIDGMSAAVCRELLADVTRQDWIVLCEQSHNVTRAGLATIPSVTEVSRASLLCGRLITGDANVEKDGFATHPGLLAQCRPGNPPMLFHKATLQEAEDSSLAAEVREAIGSSHRRVVGVIINAVDDHLLKGEQIDTRWTRDEIKVLPSLLHEAALAQRIVVFLSDHGHILDHRAVGRVYEGGERWRFDNEKPSDQELRVTGSRVVKPDNHKLIAPWTEKLRYGVKKNGYHGGLTPQEMIIPITVLAAHDTKLDGWVEAPVGTPAWWDESIVKEELSIQIKTETIPATKKQDQFGPLFDYQAQPPLEETVERPQLKEVPNWITALLASPILVSQKKLAGRALPTDETITKLLLVLDNRGGKMTSTALARSVEYPLLRLRGLLATAQRIFNIDGYGVLTRDDASDTIEFNRELLCRQFDLL
jgi:hypothetical protein